MEIIQINNNVWQLIDEANNCQVIMVGTYEECSNRLCEIENNQYRDFLFVSGI